MKLAFITGALVLRAPLAHRQTVLQNPDGIEWEPMPRCWFRPTVHGLP